MDNLQEDTAPAVSTLESQAASAFLELKMAQARAKGGIHTETVDLTPALANLLLSRNPDNRSIRGGKLGIYMKDLVEGRWRHNGQTVSVADTGELNDGQHRSKAVAVTGVTMRTEMAFGVPRDARETLDIGATRHPGDILKFAGHLNSIHLASLAKLVIAYENSAGGERGFQGANRIGTPEISERVEAADKDLLAEAATFASGHTKDLRDRMVPSMIGFTYWLLARANPIEGPAFMKRLALQDGTGASDPEWHLYRTLQSKSLRNVKPVEIAEAVVRAYNLRRQGKTGHRSPMTKGLIPTPRS